MDSVIPNCKSGSSDCTENLQKVVTLTKNEGNGQKHCMIPQEKQKFFVEPTYSVFDRFSV
jgi:hypothetical protein